MIPEPATLRGDFLNIDIIGTCTIKAALVCVLLDTQWGGVTKSWGSTDVIGTLVGFVLLTVLLFLFSECGGERRL